VFGALAVLSLLRYFPRRNKESDSHGSARWGTAKSAAKNNCLAKADAPPEGLVLGRVKKDVPAGLNSRYRIPREYIKHVLTCAPTGTRKGIGCAIPNLLEYPGSVFCLDVKGENFEVTARRRRDLGQVHVLDPFHVVCGPRKGGGVTGAETASVNPLSRIDVDSPECVSDSASLADSLVIRSSGEESHWDDTAASFLQGLVLYVAALPESERHLGTLRQVITQPEDSLTALLKELSLDEETAHGMIARFANVFLGKADRERSGVLSTAQRHTAFLDDPRVVETLKSSDLDFQKLKTEVQTVFLVMPPDKLKAYSRYSRLVLGMALKAMTKTQGLPEHPVLFMLDEFAQLGHFAPAEEALSILRGYCGCLWIMVQDLSQLQAVYPRWRSFLANTVLQAFGTQDFDTAKYLSDALGMKTVEFWTESTGRSSSSGGLLSSSNSSTDSSGKSQQHVQRPLLMPDEVRRLSPALVIVLEQALPPILLQRIDYRSDPEYKDLFDENPMYRRV